MNHIEVLGHFFRFKGGGQSGTLTFLLTSQHFKFRGRQGKRTVILSIFRIQRDTKRTNSPPLTWYTGGGMTRTKIRSSLFKAMAKFPNSCTSWGLTLNRQCFSVISRSSHFCTNTWIYYSEFWWSRHLAWPPSWDQISTTRPSSLFSLTWGRSWNQTIKRFVKVLKDG